ASGLRVAGVGIGSPGPLDSRRGIVLSAPNLTGWVNAPLGERVETAVRIPTIVENDANVAALAESWLGAGREASSVLLITLGTGIGGGIVLGGRIWRGHGGFAGEIGHTTYVVDGVACGCGNRGCLEQYASATALVRRTREAIASGRKTSLIAKPTITAAVVHEEAVAGDALCRDLLAETGRILGVAIGSVSNLLDPEVVVVAGGLVNAGDFLFAPMREEAKRRALPAVAATLTILPAALGDDAGALGAARNAALEITSRR
ncbi:MAG: ROK family protein, partial [Planctomycetes bacterium]|nr:ROK family protein [Planctomycetota bacterium]